MSNPPKAPKAPKTPERPYAERRAAVEARRDAARRAAFTWYDIPKPDLPIPAAAFGAFTEGVPATTRAFTEGWNLHFAGGEGRVFRAWSEWGAHGTGPYPGSRRTCSATQGGRALYSTRERALEALRGRIVAYAAELLAVLAAGRADATEAVSGSAVYVSTATFSGDLYPLPPEPSREKRRR